STAEAAFMQQRFPDAKRAYQAVLARGALTDRKNAALTLAVIDWKIDGDTALAMRDLRPFASTAPALTMMSRARLDAHNAVGARTAARASLAAAHDAAERRAAEVALANVAALPYETSCIDSVSPYPRARDDSLVREAIAHLRASVAAEPGHLDVSERLMRLAAITGDWAALALGWRSYYAVGRRVPNGPLVRAEEELRAIESGGANSGAAADDAAAHALAALVDSKMFEPAALIVTCGALSARAPDAKTREIAAYARFLRDAKRITNSYYRDVALARADSNAWRAQLVGAGKTLWPHLDWSGPIPAYDLAALGKELEQRFDLLTNMGVTAGVLDLHSGHRVSSEDREVTQYGKSAHVHFTVLDGMISDGYQTWAWDDRAAHGGWASDVEIVQVRDAYADGPLKVWHSRTDPTIVARDAKTLARDSIADVALARKKEIAYFPSVDARIRRDVQMQVIDSLRRTGLAGRDLELAFVRIYGDAVDESSIFAHEGRHAIDKTIHIADSSATNFEYRAKLSQIAFAPLPKIGLSGVLEPNTGDETAHGTADARLIGELFVWMRHHGFSDGAGALPMPIQLPKLSDDQLRTAVRSLDPLATDSTNSASTH
ncbi:MAG TPA: hypothetical protein VGO46_12640, partial [Gemmatimonadaceae bacterium]|nr:hypothetical protein [Gemmatimonadaceae bacterium]